MRKTRQQKVYLKAFNIFNPEGKLTEDDFKSFINKFEIIKKIYYHEEANHEYFDSFRTISKELKRSAHNAGLEVSGLKLGYKSNKEYVTILNNDDPVVVNLIVAIKSASKFGRDYSFVVTDMIGLKKPFLFISGMSSDLLISDYMRDEDKITYHFKESGDFYGTKYVHGCINNQDVI